MKLKRALLPAVLLIALAVLAGVRYQDRIVPLTEVYAPSFSHVQFAPALESLRALDTRLRQDPRLSTIRQVLPDQAGVLWISLLVMLAVGFDYSRPWSARNIDLVVVQAIGWCFIGALDLLIQTTHRNNAALFGLIRLVFEVVALLSLVLLVRLTWRAVRPDPTTWAPTIGMRPLLAIASIVAVLSVAMPLFRPIEDSSYFTALGAQRLRERGSLPYGDPLLTNSPGAAYAPLMYAAQAAVQSLLREPTNHPSPDRPELGNTSHYNAPSPVSSLLLLAGSQLLAIWALLAIGAQWGGETLGPGFVALYCASAAVLGVGGSGDQVAGMTFVSHMVPPSLMLVAFLNLEQPLISGTLLAVAAFAGFYPIFSFPAWAGYQWGRSPRSGIRFVTGFAALSLVVGVWVLLASRPADGLSLIGTVVRDTLGHQTDPNGYGMAPFGLWGQQDGVMRWMLQPLAGSSAMTSPVFLMFGGYLAGTAFLARRAGPVGLALLTATAALGANLWRIPGTGSYMNWYYPFLLIGVLGPGVLVRAGTLTLPQCPPYDVWRRRERSAQGTSGILEERPRSIDLGPVVKRPRLSVIIPVYNEAQNLEHIVGRVLNVPIDKELIIVDDGSTDGSSEILRARIAPLATNIRWTAHAKNQGKGAAIRTALKMAAGEILIIQDADLEYDPADFVAILKKFDDPSVHVVYGSRFGGVNRYLFIWHWFCNRFLGGEYEIRYLHHFLGILALNFLSNMLYGAKITDEATCYKSFRREVLEQFELKCTGFEFCPEVTAKVRKAGYTITEVPVTYHPRSRAEGKKLNWRHGFEAVFILIRYRFID